METSKEEDIPMSVLIVAWHYHSLSVYVCSQNNFVLTNPLTTKITFSISVTNMLSPFRSDFGNILFFHWEDYFVRGILQTILINNIIISARE